MKTFNFLKKKTPASTFGMLPEKEFTEKAKANFLAEFDKQYGTQPVGRYFGLGFKISVTLLALIALVTGASVYADTRNVGADNSLYSFKRFGEKMQMVFAPAAEKPQLQASFAARRLDEIDQIQAQDPSSAALPKLNNDLNTSIDATVDAQVQIDGGTGKNTGGADANDFCGRFFSVIGSASSLAHDALLKHPGIVQRLEERCGDEVK